jgi:hypothetical protein
MEREKRKLWATHRLAPLSRAASIMLEASSADMAMGFSTRTWQPRRNASMARGPCVQGGVHIDTTSRP